MTAKNAENPKKPRPAFASSDQAEFLDVAGMNLRQARLRRRLAVERGLFVAGCCLLALGTGLLLGCWVAIWRSYL